MAENYKKFKYIHVFNGSNYGTINSFTALINKRFDPAEHLIIVKDKKNNPKETISCYENVIWLPGAEHEEREKFLRLLTAGEIIFWHAMGWGWRMQAVIDSDSELIRRSVWVEWGADLYNWKRTEGGLLRRAFVNSVCKSWRRNVLATVAIFPTDVEVIKKQFGRRMTVLTAGYCSMYAEDTEKLRPSQEKAPGAPLNVQVGHSATPACHHIDALEKLSAYRDENILIHIPLTYGDPEYAIRVERKALELFPENKIRFQKQQLPLEEYIKYLWSMDVGVFNVERQIALGNIAQLLYMLKKVYLPKDSVLGRYYAENDAYYCDYALLGSEDFAAFSAGIPRTEPADCVLRYMSEKSVTAEWRIVFAAVLKLLK
ncbi:MAG: TDP-N-acetylfucosamine:lipid II N-acetylfucosaminyltransferase [Clostridia bacterium]|nr:TDP-N-acetylfucosamine:lipid II N-acetylfucosaminyltransferase [Clostridia bacterium]